MPSCLFRFPLCAQCPSMAPHQGIRDWVKPGLGLGENVQVAAQEGRGHPQKPGCWVTTLSAAHFLNLGRAHKSLTVEKSPPTLSRKDPGWVSLEQTPPTPATVPLSLLAMLQVPKRMEDFEARNQPCLPKGKCPREQRSKRMEFALGCDLTIDISGGTLQREAQ